MRLEGFWKDRRFPETAATTVRFGIRLETARNNHVIVKICENVEH